MTRRLLRLAVGVVAAVVATLALGALAPVSAHPLGNFTVNRYTGLLLSPDHVQVDHVLDLAEIPTAQLGTRIDDPARLAGSLCASAAKDLRLTVGGTPVPLRVGTSTARTRPGAAGLPVLRVQCRLRGTFPRMSGRTDVHLQDTGEQRLGWQEVTAGGLGVRLLATDVPRDSLSARLTRYPQDLLGSPPSVDSADLVVTPGATAPAADPGADPAGGAGARPAATETGVRGGVSALTTRVSGLLDDPGPWVPALALLAALALGAGHALAPGHGKTVMAFYLVDRHQHSVRAAFGVGATVTLAHTASVLVLSALVLAGTALVPERVYPWLTVASGTLILALGAGLLRSALRGGHGHTHHRTHDHAHHETRGHAHPHPHPGGPAAHHAHGHPAVHGELHEHERPVGVLVVDDDPPQPAAGNPAAPDPPATTRTPGRAGVLTLGLAGGLVPSPSALLLLLVAVHLGRPALGGLLVVAFGVGMATTLGVVGVLAAGLTHRLQARLSRRSRASGLARAAITYGAAGGVCVVGVGIVLRALTGI